MIEFSINQPENGKKYFKRVGAYAVIQNAEGLIAVAHVKTHYYLPGGGIDEGESPEDCLRRECLEEIGAEVSVGENFACGNYFFYSTVHHTDMESVGCFYECRLEKILDVESESDHELVWISMEQAISDLYLDNQKEAIRIFKGLHILS